MKTLSLEINEPDSESSSTSNLRVSSRNKRPTSKNGASLTYIYYIIFKVVFETNIKFFGGNWKVNKTVETSRIRFFKLRKALGK